MNVIPALGVYAAMMRRAGKTGARLSRRRRPRGAGGRCRPAGARHRLVGRVGRRPRNEIFNVTNGDVFVWPNVWPAIADALGFAAGEHVPLALDKEIRPREAEWAEIRAQHGLGLGHARRSSSGCPSNMPTTRWAIGRNPAGPAGAGLDHQADAGGLPRGDGYRGDVRQGFRRDAGEEAAAAALTVRVNPGRGARRGRRCPGRAVGMAIQWPASACARCPHIRSANARASRCRRTRSPWRGLRRPSADR